MKQIKYFLVLAATTSLLSCGETTKKDNVTNDPDTAVLKEDTANRLNANPINDTTITEKTNHNTTGTSHENTEEKDEKKDKH